MSLQLSYKFVELILLPRQGGTTQLHWLQEKEWCDYPSNVDCGDRPICDEFDENCTGGPGPTGGPPDGSCDAVESDCQANEQLPKGDCEQCYCQGRTEEFSLYAEKEVAKHRALQ